MREPHTSSAWVSMTIVLIKVVVKAMIIKNPSTAEGVVILSQVVVLHFAQWIK